MSITSENTFETAIIENLSASGGYHESEAGAYSPELGMFKAEVFQFLQTTQTQQWFTSDNAGVEESLYRPKRRPCKKAVRHHP